MEDKGNELEFHVSMMNCQSMFNKTKEIIVHDVYIVARLKLG